MGNTLKTTLLLASLTGLLVIVGRLVGGPSGMIRENSDKPLQ
jgi:heat shock protein HtpX